jgi:GAF domain-containing protein
MSHQQRPPPADHLDLDLQLDGRGKDWRPNSMPPFTGLIASGAAALRLGLHRSSLYLAIKRGLITPDLITPGGHARFSEATLDAYTEQLRHTFATRPSSALKGQNPLLALRNAAGAEPSLLESLRQIQRRFPAFTTLGIVEPVPPSADSPGYRIAAQIGISSAVMERFRRLFGRVSLSVPLVLARGEPVYLDDARRQPPRASGTALLLRMASHRAYAVLPLIVGNRVRGTFGVSSPEPFAFTAQTRDLLSDMAAELALLLRYQQQDNRQRAWLNAVSEYVGFHTVTSASGVESSEAIARKSNPLAHLAHAFLETYDAEDICVHGPTQTLASRTAALRDIAARVDAERPIVIETRSDAIGTLRVIALHVEMAGSHLAVGALWRVASRGISGEIGAPIIGQHEAALMTLAGVCTLSLASVGSTPQHAR